MSDKEMLEAALEWAEKGFYVLPLVPDGKVRLAQTKGREATRDPDEIRAYWEAEPNANIGIGLGLGHVALDIESIEGHGVDGWSCLKKLEDKQHDFLPPTMTFETWSGGTQVVFSHPSDGALKTTDICPGVQLRASPGSYSVVPPSVVNGRPYTMKNEWDARPLAQWLLDIGTNARSSTGSTIVQRARTIPEVVTQGQRHDSFVSLVGTFINRGISEAVAREAALAFNTEHCNPPEDEKVVLETVADCYARWDSPTVGTEITINEYPRIDLQTNVEQTPYRIICGFHKTDDGNAQRLVAYFGDIIRYCADVRSWYVWSGVKWEQDKNNQIRELAKDVVRLIHFESQFVKENDPKKRRVMQHDLDSWAYISESRVKIRDMIELASTDKRVIVNREDFNKDRLLVNFPNGTMDFRRREFREHRKEDMLSMVTRVPWNPNKKCTYFYSTLEAALPMDEAINLQRRIGLALEGTTKNKELILTYGKAYAYKSSVTQAVYEALGDYAMNFDSQLLAKSRHGIAANAARPELVVLEDVLIAWSEETPEGMVFDDATIKSLTSSGQKPGRGLFEKQRAIRFRMTLALETNGSPSIDIRDDSQRTALLRRIGVTPFLNEIPEARRDKEVLKRLTEDEDELTAALAWAVQGYFDRQDFGLIENDSVKESADRFEVDINPISPFIETQVKFDNGVVDGGMHHEVYCAVSDLYDRFRETSDRDLIERFKNVRSFNLQFKRAVQYYAKKAGVEVADKKRNFGAVWLNLCLKEVSDDVELTDLEPKVTQSDESDAKPLLWYKSSYIDFSTKGYTKDTTLRHPSNYPMVKIGLGASILESENGKPLSGE